jgi:EmrB/QacA subfamily drug resistance transporter
LASEVNKSNTGNPKAMLFVLMAGLFLAILNQTLLNVAVPHLMTEFGVETSTIQWLTTGYMLVNGVLIPLSAFLITRFGSRSLFLTAMMFFTVGTLVCGLATNFPIMMAGRIIQAVGGGILQPLVMTTIMFIFPPESRGKGMGVFGLAMMFAPAAGPTLSGWIIEHFSWRIMFTGLVPLCCLVLLAAFFVFRNMVEPKKIKIDIVGTVLSVIGFALLLYGVSEAGSKGWDDPIVVVTVIVGVISIAAFVIQQLKSSQPMLDFRVFKYDIFSLSSVLNVIITIALFSGIFLLPIYLQNLLGFSALDSGLLLLPGALVMLVMSPISGILFDKYGPRPLAIAGLIITAVTTFDYAFLTLQSSFTHIMVIYMIRALGISLLMMPVMTAGMNQLPRELNSHGTAMANTLRQISGSLGISLITTVYTNRTTFHYAAMADQTSTANPTFMHNYESYVQSIAGHLHVPLEEAKQILYSTLLKQVNLGANVMGINDAFFLTALLCGIGAILAFFLRDVRKDHLRKKAARKKNVQLLPAPKETSES